MSWLSKNVFKNKRTNKRFSNLFGKKGLLGKAWDYTSGRKSFNSVIGEKLGLWDSGYTMDRKNKKISAINKDIEALRANNEISQRHMFENLNRNIYTDQRKTGGLIGQIRNSGNLATDTSRTVNANQVVADSIARSNTMYGNTIIKSMDRDRQTEDSITARNIQKDQIKES